jgi:Tyrosine-protein kinase ephrin type A/B receptor-like
VLVVGYVGCCLLSMPHPKPSLRCASVVSSTVEQLQPVQLVSSSVCVCVSSECVLVRIRARWRWEDILPSHRLDGIMASAWCSTHTCAAGCAPGFGLAPPAPSMLSQTTCVRCGKGTYSPGGSLTPCIACPYPFMSTPLGATRIEDCICQPGRQAGRQAGMLLHQLS